MWQIENAVREVLALDIDSGFRCKEGACTCPFIDSGLLRVCLLHIRGPLGAASRYDPAKPRSPCNFSTPEPGLDENANSPRFSPAVRRVGRQGSIAAGSCPAHSSSGPTCDAACLGYRDTTACRTFGPSHRHSPSPAACGCRPPAEIFPGPSKDVIRRRAGAGGLGVGSSAACIQTISHTDQRKSREKF